MSRWQDSAEDGGDPLQGWDEAFALYLRYLSWGPLGTGPAFLIPFLPLGIMALGQPWSVTLVQLRLPAIAIICAALPAYALSMICLGPESRANEAFYLSNLAQAGFDPRQGYNRLPPPLGWAPLTWLTYLTDISCYPGRNSGWFNNDYTERNQAWRTMNGIINAYYRASMVAGLPPVRPGDLVVQALQLAVMLSSLALLLAYTFIHQGIPHPSAHPPMGGICTLLVFFDSVILLSIRDSARLEAFIHALQTHLEELPALAADPSAGAADQQDPGWG